MTNWTLKQHVITTPWAVMTQPEKRVLPTVRFGQEQDQVTLTTPRNRRTKLYLDFLQAPVTQAKEKKEQPNHYGRYDRYDRFGFSEMRMMERERETPESVKASLEKRPLVSLPTDYKPTFNSRIMKKAPYTLPTVSHLLSLRAGRTMDISIPPVKEDNIQVRPPKVSPYMDMSSGSIASKMVSAGLQPSEIAEEYQAKWSPEKVSRDILQNFFDSHGQTLEGVKFEVQRVPSSDTRWKTWAKSWFVETDPNPAYRVKIYGRGQYDFEKAYVLGASDKQEDDVNAGGYGEGLKIIALNLLRDYGAQYVKTSSANWAMTYTLPEGQEEEGKTPKLYNHLEHITQPSKQAQGNYFEFVTTKPEFVEALLKASNYFYHPYNPDFQEQTYENKVGGFKLLPAKQKGNAYIAMQRYEYEKKGDWENAVPDMSVWKRTKAEKTKVDRDRTHLSEQEVQDVLSAIAEKMTREEAIYTLRQLEPYWGKQDLSSTKARLACQLRSKLQYTHKVKIDFPPQYLAANLSGISERLKMSSWKADEYLQKKGFILCHSDFCHIGMRLASDALAETKPDAFKPPEEVSTDKSLKGYIKDLTQAIEETKAEIIAVSPQEQIRFHVLDACLKALAPHFSTYNFYQFSAPTLTLGKENGYDTEYNSTSNRYDHIFQVSPETLKVRGLEQSLFQALAVSILKNRVNHDSADYTYKLTDLSVELAKMFLTSKPLRDRYADLRAVWELSWHPDNIVEQIQGTV